MHMHYYFCFPQEESEALKDAVSCVQVKQRGCARIRIQLQVALAPKLEFFLLFHAVC